MTSTGQWVVSENLARPKPGQLATLAKKAPGALFLYDHNGYSSGARIGTVTAGEVVSFRGKDALVLEWDITNPEAQERYVRGEMDRFSIGLAAKGAECSVCGGKAHRGWFGYSLECGHELGKRYPSEETGDRVLAEVFLTGAELREVSTVNFPAVPNTAVLSEFGRLAGFNTTPKEEDAMSDETPIDESAVRLAEMEAKLAALEAEKQAADQLAFNALFNQAVSENRVLPREEDDQRAIFESVGRDRFQSMLANRPVLAGFAREAAGVACDSPADAEPKVDDLALAKFSRRIRRSNITEAKLDEIGFNELNIIEG